MWKRILRFFRLKQRRMTPAEVAESLQEDVRKEALEHARLLFSQGVWVRDLLPGEVPSDTPEIENTPLQGGKP